MRESMAALPVRAVYTIGELARACAMDRRRLVRMLRKAGVQIFRVGAYWLVTLSELEKKASPLWEAIKAAEMLRHGLDAN